MKSAPGFVVICCVFIVFVSAPEFVSFARCFHDIPDASMSLHGLSIAQWLRTFGNLDVSTGPCVRLLALHCSLRSNALLRSLTRTRAHGIVEDFRLIFKVSWITVQSPPILWDPSFDCGSRRPKRDSCQCDRFWIFWNAAEMKTNLTKLRTEMLTYGRNARLRLATWISFSLFSLRSCWLLNSFAVLSLIFRSSTRRLLELYIGFLSLSSLEPSLIAQ